MAKFVICGQAPSRVGDGRAFSRPSGRRLAKLFGLEDYENLAAQVTLTNIFEIPASPRPLPLRGKKNAPGDQFDKTAARTLGRRKVKKWAEDPKLVVVLACGKPVYEALTGSRGEFFKGKAITAGPAQGVDVWCFPHPSGASMFWNDRDNVLQASRFLKRLLKRYGIKITK